MMTSSAFCVLLFFGGYHLPFVSLTHPEAVGLLPAIVKFLVFFNKVILSVVFMMIIRWTIPRIRYDQVLKLGWQSLIRSASRSSSRRRSCGTWAGPARGS
ncbi:MAG: NADH-quinone oxidoreductase subunit H [Phycisphaerales bacterium]